LSTDFVALSSLPAFRAVRACEYTAISSPFHSIEVWIAIMARLAIHIPFPSMPMRQRTDAPELLDEPVIDPALLRENLGDIRRVNSLFGGVALILRHLSALVEQVPDNRPVSILDLATGSADIPLAISRWAGERGRSVRIVASDLSEQILAVAQEQTEKDPAIAVERFDARHVPLADSSFDIVLCSLALHHFSPREAVMVLREMARLATCGFILSDLRRSRAGYLGTLAASRVFTRNQLTRHDAPLSFQRAYSPAELCWMLHQAGIPEASVVTAPWFRMAAVSKTC
jgi:2-polyprenyl-3-methyl-5-hydroxy-6-metoxy-1,4-benzoquinol methylase